MDAILLYLANTFTVTKIKVVLSMIYSWFAYIIGGFDLMVEALYILLILDFTLGFISAWNTHTVSKKKMQLWTVKIVTYSITLIVINYADIATLWANIGGVGIREIWVGYLSVNEALSCLKHLTSFGVPLPVWLIKKLEGYRDNLETTDFK